MIAGSNNLTAASREMSPCSALVSLRTADAFPVVASLPPEGEKQRPEMRLLFAGYALVGNMEH